MGEAAALIGVSQPVILAVDNGGTNTRVAQGGENIADWLSYPTPENYERAVKTIAQTSRLLLDSVRPDVVGFSIAGKPEDGRLVQAGELANYGWLDLPFAKDVAAELGVDEDRVLLLNDCVAGANAERTVRKPGRGEAGAFMVLSTGFGGAVYTADRLIGDEPGHEFLRGGAICGDGEDGHMEAHIGGAGIKRKFGIPGEIIPHDDLRWLEIKQDFANSIIQTLARYRKEYGLQLQRIGFTGSVALGGPDMLGGLQERLTYRMGRSMAPEITEAMYRDESGLYGAYFAARDLLHDAEPSRV